MTKDILLSPDDVLQGMIDKLENKAYEKYLLNQTNFDETMPEKYHNQAKLAVKDEYTFDFLEMKLEHSEKVKLPEENPSIEIIICKSKKRTVVE